MSRPVHYAKIWNSEDMIIALWNIRTSNQQGQIYYQIGKHNEFRFTIGFSDPPNNWNIDYKQISWKEFKEKYNIEIGDLLDEVS